jgi:hypothetical protein
MDVGSVGLVTARGTPGTMACLTRDLTSKRLLFLTAGHLLCDVCEGDPVWTTAEADASLGKAPFGFARWSKVGVVNHLGRDCFIDCAVGTVAADDVPLLAVALGPAPQMGEAVFKWGQGSGGTHGTVIAVDHAVEHVLHGRSFRAPGQILVQPAITGAPFSALADSGALLYNAAEQAIGLLWGVNSRGEGLACPLDAVIATLGITLETGMRPALLECAW